MTKHANYVGGKGKPASVKPPKAAPVIPQLHCPCGDVHNIHLIPDTLQIIIPCKCGALLRYYPQQNSTTIEHVET